MEKEEDKNKKLKEQLMLKLKSGKKGIWIKWKNVCLCGGKFVFA